MSRTKKTRKTGPIGVQKSSTKQNGEDGKKPKKSSGKISGSRNSAHLKETSVANTGGKQTDRRIGSKTKIKLVADPVSVKKKDNSSLSKPRFSSPKEELEYIENDKRFNTLLDRQEQNSDLSHEEIEYVEQCLKRHRVLCELLGISLLDEEQTDATESDTTETDNDLLEQLENPTFKDF